MKFEDLVDALSPERHLVLKRAVELGKWADGRTMGADERETSLQLLIAYDHRHKAVEERIGYVPTPKQDECDHEAPSNHTETSRLIVKSQS